MHRAVAAAILGLLLNQEPSDAAAEKARLHEELAKAAESTGEQLIKLKAWDEARAFLEILRAKSDARAEALDKLIGQTEKQTSGLKWDAKPSDLVKAFGTEQAKPFSAFAKAWKENDAEAARWTDAEGSILEDLLDYVKAYARLSQIRTHYELPKTRFDWKLSVPAVWHARYKLLNPTHSEEVAGSNSYSIEGHKAGRRSVTSPDESLCDLLEAISHTPFHRNYVLHPGLLIVGFGQAKGESTTSVIDVKSGLRSTKVSSQFLLIPRDKSTGVALTGYDDHIRVDREKSMKELGYPLSMVFFDSSIAPKGVRATVTESMKAIDLYVSTPEAPLVDVSTPNQSNTILIVPKQRLKPETEYRVTIQFTSNGEESRVTWTFRTGR